MTDTALAGLRVLDLTHYVAGPYCTKLLADFGAEVVKVERPDGGDPARRMGPFPDDNPDPEASGLFFYLNNNKRSITLNLKTATGARLFEELVKRVDVLVESFHPRVMPGFGLGYETLRQLNPALVMTSISNYGQTGPYRDYKGSDLILQAIGGWIRLRHHAERGPFRVAGGLEVVGYVGGGFAAPAILTALAYARRTGIGQQVDLSLMETVYNVLQFPVAMATFAFSPGWAHEKYPFVPSIEQCKDGFVGINILTGQHWRSLCEMMGMEDLVDHPDFSTRPARSVHAKELRDRMRPWLMARTAEEVIADGQDFRIPCAMVYNAEGMLGAPQNQARGYFVEIEHPVLGKVTQPGGPFRMSETPWRIARPAPRLGEHNEEIYCDRLGFSRADMIRLRQSGAI